MLPDDYLRCQKLSYDISLILIKNKNKNKKQKRILDLFLFVPMFVEHFI